MLSLFSVQTFRLTWCVCVCVSARGGWGRGCIYTDVMVEIRIRIITKWILIFTIIILNLTSWNRQREREREREDTVMCAFLHSKMLTYGIFRIHYLHQLTLAKKKNASQYVQVKGRCANEKCYIMQTSCVKWLQKISPSNCWYVSKSWLQTVHKTWLLKSISLLRHCRIVKIFCCFYLKGVTVNRLAVCCCCC